MKTDIYIPENASDEAAMLMGRVNALAAVMACTKSKKIRKEIVKAVIGIEPEEDDSNV